MSMTTIRVPDFDDVRLKVFTDLTNHQLRNRIDPQQGLCIVESELAIRVALEEGVTPVAFLLDERKLAAMGDVLEEVPDEVPVYVLPPDEAERITGYRVTRGALCAMRRPQRPELTQLFEHASRVVVLEGMTDASNVGATFRNAAALGADVVVVAPTCADPLCRRAVRVSVGNVLRVPWAMAPRPWPGALMDALACKGFIRLALALREDAVSLAHAADVMGKKGKVALFLGAEGPGLTHKVIDACDASVIIPMSRGVDSLNVAAAGAVAMWSLFQEHPRYTTL